MKSTRYSVYCHKVFGGFLSKRYKKDFIKQKNIELEKANIAMVYEEYISKAVMNMILGAIIAPFVALFLYYLISSLLTIVLIPVIIFLIPGFIWQYYQFLPISRIKKRAVSIDRFLPYAVNFISTMATAGVSPVEIFRSLSTIDAYGELQVESKKIVKRIDGMGVDNLSTLKHAIDVSPSKKFKAFLQGMIGSIQSGSDLHVYLANIVDNYMDEEFISRKKNLEMLSIISEIFVMSVVAFPLFLVIILSVMGFFGGGSGGSTISILFAFSFIVLPIAYVGFYFLIKSTSFEEMKKKIGKKRRKGFKGFYKDNRGFVKVILLTVVLLLSIYGVVFLLSNYGYFVWNDVLFFDLFFVSVLVLIGPIGFYAHRHAKGVSEIQERLSDFFMELGNSVSSGMNAIEGIKVAAAGNYGRLTDEIIKMKVELSWRYSITHVFDNFVDRMNSGVIQRVFITINKGLQMGGETEKVFKAAAREINQVNRIEEEKKASMSIYTIIIFMSFFVFLAIILILDKSLFAAFFETSKLAIPDEPAIASRALSISNMDPVMFKYALFSFVFVQGVGSGLLGGYMMDGKLSSGVRYSFALGLISIIVFKLLF